MLNNPLINVFSRTKASRSTSKASPIIQKKSKVNNILTNDVYNIGEEEMNK